MKDEKEEESGKPYDMGDEIDAMARGEMNYPLEDEEEDAERRDWDEKHPIVTGDDVERSAITGLMPIEAKRLKSRKENNMSEEKELTEDAEELMPIEAHTPVSQGTSYDLQPAGQFVPEVRPAEVIARAQEQAKSLMDIVEQQKLYAVIQGKKYLQVEAWQLLAAFNGLSIVIEETQEIEKDGSKGWESRCVIYNAEGRRVGAGEAQCMNDESKATWRKADDYARRSMAQTRAISKACRTILSFVVVLAGYEPTPYEEMSGVVFDNDDKVGLIEEIKHLAKQERIDNFLAQLSAMSGKEVTSLEQVSLAKLRDIVKSLRKNG